jgi:hypothetical protein
MGSPYYHRELEDTSPALPGHHRSRSASRPPHTIDYPSNYKTNKSIKRYFSLTKLCFINNFNRNKISKFR